MGIDIAIVVVLFLAFVSGFQKGLVATVFYVLSIVAGFFITMHFSFLVSEYFNSNFNISGRWVPVIAFIVTFSLVVLLIRIIGKIAEKGLILIVPSLFNRLLGSLLWMGVAMILFCVLYNVLLTAGIFKPQLIEASQAVPYLEEGNRIMREKVGDIVPFVKGLYTKADTYFAELARKSMEIIP